MVTGTAKEASRTGAARLRTVGLVAGTFLFALLAYLPLFRAGLLAPDYELLLRAEAELPLASDALADRPRLGAALLPGPMPELEALPRWSLTWAGSLATWREGPFGLQGRAALLRLVHVALLAVGALGVGALTRRFLEPWTGDEHARAAGWSAALLLSVHPLAAASVASVAARGELFALAFSGWAIASFLRSRQEKERGFTVLSLVLCALAGACSDVALGVPLLLAGAELLSSRRRRPQRTRLRTAATTFLVYGAATWLRAGIETWRGTGRLLPGFLDELRGGVDAELVVRWTGRAIEKLGLFVLPSNPYVTEFFGFALAGAAFLLAVHPGLAAARSAPRLWGWVLWAWFLALCGSELLHLDVAVGHGDLARAPALLSSTAVMAVGLGVGSTALSGLRRVLYPGLVALGYAALAHANTLPWRGASQRVEELRIELQEVRERYGEEPSLLVLDPPVFLGGLRPIGESLDALSHPLLRSSAAGTSGEPFGDAAQRDTPRGVVLGLSSPAFLSFADQPEFDALRAAGAVLLTAPQPGLAVPEDDAPGNAPGNAAGNAAGALGNRVATRTAVALPPPQPSGRPLSWRGTLRSPNLDLEAARVVALLLRVPADARFAADEPVSWRAREQAFADGSRSGNWFRDELGDAAWFDVGSLLSWRLGDRIKRVWFEEGLSAVEEVSAVLAWPGLYGPATAPALRGADLGGTSTSGQDSDPAPDWVFPAPDAPELLARFPEHGLRLRLLELRGLRISVWKVQRQPDGSLRVPGAAAFARTCRGPLAWCLEAHVSGHVVARTEGRLEAP